MLINSSGSHNLSHMGWKPSRRYQFNRTSCNQHTYGFNKKNMPTSITLVGKLYDEATILAIAKVYQDAIKWNKMHPRYFE